MFKYALMTGSGKISYKFFIVIFLINTNCYVILMLFYSIRWFCIASLQSCVCVLQSKMLL